MDAADSVKRMPWMVILVFLGLSLVISLAGFLIYRSGKVEIKKNIENDLAAIADLKVHLIETWRGERLADASVIRDNQLIAGRIAQWLKKPEDPAFTGSLLIWMVALQRENGYQSVLLLDPSGKPRLGTRSDNLADSCDQECLSAAMHSRNVVLSDLYRTREGRIYLDLYTPLLQENERGAQVIAVMVLRIDPYKFLFPLIQSWPTPSRSAETLIVRQEGNRVLFLNDLRHREGSALTLSAPLQAPQSPSMWVGTMQRGVAEGIDYRGVPVLAAHCPVPGTPWVMVAKVDAEEIYAPIRERARTTFIVVLLLMAVVGTGVSIGWKHQATQFYRKQLESERERQALARQAAESFSQLAAIVESSGDGIIGVDLVGAILSWNPGAARMFGYQAEEILRKPFLSLFAPARSGAWAGIMQPVKEGNCLHDYETTLLAKNGSVREVSLTISPIRDSMGQVVGASTIARDITERKRAEAERAKLLEREQEARQQAEEASRMKDDFLATVSHELRTPLNPILGWAYNLRTGGQDANLLQEGLESIERNARVLSQLVEDLLDVSRIVTGKLKMNVQPVDLQHVIEAAAENFHLAARAKRIEWVLHFDADIPRVAGDPERLQQVFWNLLSNALKFTPEGGRIEVRLRRADSHVEASITDSGEGIPPDFLPRVFDRFSQADSFVTRKHGGLGVGLAIVRHLVELHGGTIRAESAGTGRGATFSLQLPVITAPEYAARATSATE
ncbi:MAG: PAS domain S-box protein [Acidobacteria bacterium]|nr:PAS domain S-box protein [Acidobacteriota bacterium]